MAKLTVVMPRELHNELKVVCFSSGIRMSTAVQQAVMAWLRTASWKDGTPSIQNGAKTANQKAVTADDVWDGRSEDDDEAGAI